VSNDSNNSGNGILNNSLANLQIGAGAPKHQENAGPVREQIMPGGISRVTFGHSVETDATPVHTAIRANDGGTRVNVTTGTVESFGVTKHTMRDDRTSNNILETARSPSGSTHGPITPHHSVLVPGYGELSVGAAVRMGFIRRDGDSYVVTEKGRHTESTSALLIKG